ncbi:MAG: hypothetical protein J6Z45_02020 [Oscillospiraceae bacterium]|nr:hypothetical protein [Oscillospiraceae bacterium]
MKMKKNLAAAVSVSLAAAALAVSPIHASAAATYSTTKAEGTNTTVLNKYLVLDAEANVPNAEFTFTVTPGEAVDADIENGKLAVLAGVGSPALTNGTMTFSPADTAAAEADKGTDTPVFATADTTDEQYVKKQLTLDFTDVAFTEPGVYRYIITEAGTNQGITNGYSDGELTRTLDVYVFDAGTDDEDGNPQLTIAGYVMYEGTVTDAPNAETAEDADPADNPNGAEVDGAVKNDSITNLYESCDLTFSKTVTGNQGSKDKYFAFTVKIANAVPGAQYDVSYDNADAAISANPNAATTCITEDVTQPAKLYMTADGTSAVSETNAGVAEKEFTFYLQNGQSIEIKGLAKGTEYTVTEAPEDYTPSAVITGDTMTGDGAEDGTPEAIALADNAMHDDFMQADAEIDFTNNRQGVIPTGILSTLAGSLCLTAIGAAGIAGGMLYVKKKKSGSDEEE